MWTRRRMIGSLAPLAAGAMLIDEVAAADSSVPDVVDRNTKIKITKLTATPAKAKVFIKIETNMGIVGWGEIDQLDRSAAIALVNSLFRLLDGENPTRVEYLWQKLFRSHRDMRGGPFMTHVIAGIDMALWDITGKLWGVPIHRLMGGPCRDKVAVYPSAKATKVGAGAQPFGGTPAQLDGFVKLVAGAREKLGPDGLLMFDAHCALPPPFLMQLAPLLEPYKLLYIEEPAVPGNIEVFKRLKEVIRIPLAVGEQARTIWDVIPYLQEGVADILQIDCAHTGGMSQLRKIATLGEGYQIPIAPHCVTTDLGMTASLHVSAAVPMFLIHEYYPSITPKGLIRKQWTVEDGYASVPEGPGLGCEVDEAVLAQLAKEPYTQEWPTRGRLPDGSISDY
ncbi:MAG: mandelate racemase/muconate lactonizing enzyme family protein [Planctomycetia bacterium]|nr:mandelate racemase/muconate lactonizing enzyme family protein [Planctomycetia bacterium]